MWGVQLCHDLGSLVLKIIPPTAIYMASSVDQVCLEDSPVSIASGSPGVNKTKCSKYFWLLMLRAEMEDGIGIVQDRNQSGVSIQWNAIQQ